jgi:hypothetical protein
VGAQCNKVKAGLLGFNFDAEWWLGHHIKYGANWPQTCSVSCSEEQSRWYSAHKYQQIQGTSPPVICASGFTPLAITIRASGECITLNVKRSCRGWTQGTVAALPLAHLRRWCGRAAITTATAVFPSRATLWPFYHVAVTRIAVSVHRRWVRHDESHQALATVLSSLSGRHRANSNSQAMAPNYYKLSTPSGP